MEKVPFVILAAQHADLREEVLEAWRGVMERDWYILGAEVEAFEREFAAYCGAAQAIGVGNGLDALTLSLKAFGVGKGDRVLVPAHTFIATACAVSWTGAEVVLTDVDPQTANLTAPRIAEADPEGRAKAVVPVHLYGQICEMNEIMALSERRGFFVLEDNAQAQGASLAGRRTGAWGHAAGTSFYPGKNLGALGDAGAVTTMDSEINRRVRQLRNYGSDRKYYHEVVGVNSRLDEVQAAALRIKLRRLDKMNAERRALASHYIEALSDIGELDLPHATSADGHVYHLFVVRFAERERLQAHLAKDGIETLIHYPVPVHRQRAYEHLGLKEGQFPVAEDWARRCLSLPLYPGLRSEQQGRVIDSIRGFFGRPSLSEA